MKSDDRWDNYDPCAHWKRDLLHWLLAVALCCIFIWLTYGK